MLTFIPQGKYGGTSKVELWYNVRGKVSLSVNSCTPGKYMAVTRVALWPNVRGIISLDVNLNTCACIACVWDGSEIKPDLYYPLLPSVAKGFDDCSP